MATFIGIDVSKEKLDICVKTEKGIYSHFVKKNNKSDIKSFFKAYQKEEDLVIALENTGKYCWYLYNFFEANEQATLYVLNPLDLKRRMGLKRGKNDKIDAQFICQYIEINHQQEKVWKAPGKSIERLKVLVNERDSLVKKRAGVKNKKRDLNLLGLINMDKTMRSIYDKQIKNFTLLIKELEVKIQEVINADSELKKQETLIKSVPGVGKVSSFTILAKTNGFTKFTSARQMACMAGVVPFDNQSGKFRGKSKVSFYADKAFKSILHLAAMRVIQMENEMSKYYHRKVKEGKAKMSVLNAVRNKIIHRVFAVIKNQKKYEDNLTMS